MLSLSVDGNLAPTLAALRAGRASARGGRGRDAPRVVVGHPQLLGYSPSAKLAPQLRFLRRAACASDAATLRRLVERSPKTLGHRRARNLAPTLRCPRPSPTRAAEDAAAAAALAAAGRAPLAPPRRPAARARAAARAPRLIAAQLCSAPALLNYSLEKRLRPPTGDARRGPPRRRKRVAHRRR